MARVLQTRLTSSEADAYVLSSVRRTPAWTETAGGELVSAIKEPVRSDCPWVLFLRARERLLQSFLAFERSPGIRSGEGRTLRESYLRFSLALDRITVPHEYWSDLPHEDVQDRATHEAVVGLLSDFERRFQLLSGRERVEVAPSAEEAQEGEAAALELAESLSKEADCFTASVPSRHVAPALSSEADIPQWPHDGPYSRP
ncbi:hypothetical protein JCM8097_009155 [Rhodosporidiobolus ruineniae]